jgi:cyclic lactone autoinducer peptide
VVVSLRRRNGTQGVVLVGRDCRFFSVEEALLSSIARVAEVEADVVSSSSSSFYYYS